MIIENRFELYNVDCLLPSSDGVRICRVPEQVRQQLLPVARDEAAFSATGVEIRFVMNPGCSSVKLRLNCLAPFMIVQLNFGSFQGGWKYLYCRGLFPGENELTIERPSNMEALQKAAQERGHAFSPEVMRICFRSGLVSNIELEGDIRPPRADEVPKDRILFYGSSITHGSLALLPCCDYASVVCRELGMDLINKGCAGSCRMEKAMVDYLTGRNDYAFCVFEAASNVPTDTSKEAFQQSLMYMLQTYLRTHPGQKMFVIDDLIVLNAQHDQRHQQVRECLEKLHHPDLIHVDGYRMLPNPDLISADFVHPTVEGHQAMAAFLLEKILHHLPLAVGKHSHVLKT